MITKKKADKCTTHFICDCHQHKIEQMEQALKVISTWASVYADIESTSCTELRKAMKDIEALAMKALGRGE